MKLLLGTCAWGGAAETLSAAGHDVRWMGELTADPGDEAIMRIAFEEGRVLITLDKDFGELAIVYGKPHCGIVRLVSAASATAWGILRHRSGAIRPGTNAWCTCYRDAGPCTGALRGLSMHVPDSVFANLTTARWKRR